MGIEPISTAWKAVIIPLYYTRKGRRIITKRVTIAIPLGAIIYNRLFLALLRSDQGNSRCQFDDSTELAHCF